MDDLARLAINAHGGLDRWRKLRRVSARLVNGGALWAMKGKEGVMSNLHVTVDLRRAWASHWPFTKPGQHTSFQPDRVAIKTSDGAVIEERFNPRDSFQGHNLGTPWDNLQLAYFAGYAMWTYLNTPFLLAFPGVEADEIGEWRENGSFWRRLKATFPYGIATHSTTQTFYFSQRGLLQRHDYELEVCGGTPAVHYASQLRQFSGISVPTKRRIFGRGPDGRAVLDPLMVSIDISEVRFE